MQTRITPHLAEYIEDYMAARADYLDLLRRIGDKIDDEVASVKDAEPYQYEVFRRDGIVSNRDFFFAFHKKLFIEAAETKAKMKYIAELIDRRATQLGLDRVQVWREIAEGF